MALKTRVRLKNMHNVNIDEQISNKIDIKKISETCLNPFSINEEKKHITFCTRSSKLCCDKICTQHASMDQVKEFLGDQFTKYNQQICHICQYYICQTKW